MNIKDKILADLKDAQKNKQSEKVQVLRGLISSIKNFEIENKTEINQSQTIEILRREVKQRKEALAQFKQAGRADLVKESEEEIESIEKYLPELMSQKEIEEEVAKIIKKTGAKDKSEMGKVMGQAMSSLKGQAEGEEVKKVVLKLLK